MNSDSIKKTRSPLTHYRLSTRDLNGHDFDDDAEVDNVTIGQMSGRQTWEEERDEAGWGAKEYTGGDMNTFRGRTSVLTENIGEEKRDHVRRA